MNVGWGGGGERGRKEGWGTEMHREGEGGPWGVETWETKLGVNSVCRMRKIYLRNGILYIRDIHMLYTVQYSGSSRFTSNLYRFSLLWQLRWEILRHILYAFFMDQCYLINHNIP